MPAPESHSVPPVDVDYILEMTGGDPSFLKELFRTFLDDINLRLPQIEAAMDPFDGQRAYELAHTFVGTATCLGAQELHRSAQQFEKDASTSRLAESQDSFLDFRAELLRTAEFCREQLESLG